MRFIVKPLTVLLLTLLATAGCSSPPVNDPYNPPDEQRSRANKAQDELSKETSGN